MCNGIEDSDELTEEATDSRHDVLLLGVIPTINFDNIDGSNLCN